MFPADEFPKDRTHTYIFAREQFLWLNLYLTAHSNLPCRVLRKNRTALRQIFRTEFRKFYLLANVLYNFRRPGERQRRRRSLIFLIHTVVVISDDFDNKSEFSLLLYRSFSLPCSVCGISNSFDIQRTKNINHRGCYMRNVPPSRTHAAAHMHFQLS